MTLVTKTTDHVWTPRAVVHEELTQVNRNTVLRPVQVVATGWVWVLIVQFQVNSDRRRDLLAETERAEWSIFSVAVVVLEIHANRTGDVPAVVEILGTCNVNNCNASNERGSQEANLHL